MKKIKKISQKLQDGSFSPLFPIGADGLNIDMLSGSNLEEELHLGSPSHTSFDINDDGEMVITEEYKKEKGQTDNYYTMITTFGVVNNEMIITQKLYFNETLKKTKNISFVGSEIEEEVV